jgi:menaquinone-9 beta-reductase
MVIRTIRDVDVLVIGAGPAGLSSGIVFARSGLKTLVCERSSIPVEKACGEGIMPVGVRHLIDLGAAGFLSEGDYFPFKGICYRIKGGPKARANFREGQGWGVRREVLMDALLKQACRNPLLEICEQVQVRPLALENGFPIASAGTETVCARLLVGADGLNSPTRLWAGLKGPGPAVWRWGAVQHYRIPPWSDAVEVYWGDGIEAYITPLGTELLGAAFLWDRERFSTLQGGPRLLASLMSAFPELSNRLPLSARTGRINVVGPLQRRVHSPIADGTVLVGDAAGYLDAITGEGLSLSFAQALALEKYVVPHMLSNQGAPVSVDSLKPYLKAHKRIIAPYRQAVGLALFFSRRPALTKLVVSLLAKSPALFQILVSASMGLPPWPTRSDSWKSLE